MDYAILSNYGLCFLAGVIIIAFMLKGFFLPWWRVKRSGGNKILVQVKNILGSYYCAGRIDNGFLYYTARKRKDNPNASRMINVTNSKNIAVYKSFGVSCIDVDDEKNCVFVPYNYSKLKEIDPDMSIVSYETVSGFNAELVDEAMTTALAKPSLLDGLLTNKQFQIFVLLGLVLVCIGIYMVWDQGRGIDAHLKLIYDQTTPIYNKMFNLTG